MKNSFEIPKQIAFFSLVCGLFMYNCGPNVESFDTNLLKDSSPPCSMNFASEDSINLINHVFDTIDAVTEITQFTLNVGSTASSTLPILADSISKNAFCFLKEYADSLHLSDPGCNNFISAVKITLGLDSGLRKITLLFQPAYLCLIGSSGNTGTYQLKGISTNYFKYNTASESFFALTDTTSKQRYIDYILIAHKNGEAKSSFRQAPAGNDTLGDVISVIFSFQEIISLINDNANTAYVKIWNAIQNNYVTSVGYYMQKHTLILGPRQLNVPITPFTPVGSGIFSNKFANLGHLCPPSCNALSFERK